MSRILRAMALAGVLVACKDSVGLKPPSAKSTLLEVVTTVSKSVIGVGDTATFGYSLKNISGDTLTLTTNTGCQISPELDQVEGQRVDGLFALQCPVAPTVRTLAPDAMLSFGVLLRGFDQSLPSSAQTPGYLLLTGTYDASMVVRANELPAPVRSDWVRFRVR